jgi:hypothetical protein
MGGGRDGRGVRAMRSSMPAVVNTNPPLSFDTVIPINSRLLTVVDKGA